MWLWSRETRTQVSHRHVCASPIGIALVGHGQRNERYKHQNDGAGLLVLAGVGWNLALPLEERVRHQRPRNGLCCGCEWAADGSGRPSDARTAGWPCTAGETLEERGLAEGRGRMAKLFGMIGVRFSKPR